MYSRKRLLMRKGKRHRRYVGTLPAIFYTALTAKYDTVACSIRGGLYTLFTCMGSGRMTDMESLVVHPQFKPQFRVGQEVWIILSRGEVKSSRVQGVRFELIGEPEAAMLHCIGYTLPILGSGNGTGETFAQCDLHEREEIARQLAVWRPIVPMSDEEWTQAIGNKGDEESIDDSELDRRCKSIDAIRDFLAVCRETGGLIERDVQKIIALIDLHNHWNLIDASRAFESPLQNVFSQLGISPPKTH